MFEKIKNLFKSPKVDLPKRKKVFHVGDKVYAVIVELPPGVPESISLLHTHGEVVLVARDGPQYRYEVNYDRMIYFSKLIEVFATLEEAKLRLLELREVQIKYEKCLSDIVEIKKEHEFTKFINTNEARL